MFGSAKNKNQLEKQPPDFAETLKKNFEFAQYGNHCRTRAFRNEDTADSFGVEWLRAMEDPLTRRWHIYRFRHRGAELSCTPTESGPFTFFEAVEHLAQYEISQPDFGASPVGEDAKALGNAYFRTFAEKENIAFDLDGLPHPTLHGLLATPGRFSADTEEKLKQQAKTRAETGAGEKPSSAVRLQFEKAAAAAGNAVDRLILAYDTAEAFDRFLEDVKGLGVLMDYYRLHFDNGQKSDLDMARLLGMSYSDLHEARAAWERNVPLPTANPEDNFSGYCFYWRLATAEKSLADALGEAGTELLGRKLKEQALCFEALRANAFLRHIYSYTDDRNEMKRLHALALASMDRRAADLACDPHSLHLLKTASMSEKPMPLPENVAAFRLACETVRKNLEDSIRIRKEIMSRPPAPDSNRPGRP